ncbi:hypothetical protein [Actinopolymorpha rutila]|uniref:Uncharacterized protein n=1 Tax=Actinopolymorpha rutila TaxID=446787 RepID=A0A852ZMF6_9ACTN|nr:hypothetical protein [Actinopolymorpha rutila]NYH93463.1 hypothetical protein [Actinopolymorpha rutila]
MGIPAPPRGRRLRLFCDAYGLLEREEFLDQLHVRLLAMETAFARRSIDYFDTHRADWQRHLA